MTNAVRASHKDFFNAPAVQAKFTEVLGKNSSQFITSLLSIVNNSNLLSKAGNDTIMTAAMTAATLNLPIQPSLGFAYIVPYKGQAQFQIGYKGLIQLAIRSGQIKNINSGIVYKSQFKAYDPLFETLEVDFAQPADEVAGYFATLELVNGFKKLTYWTKEQAYAHGKRFSMSFNKGPWKTDFDAMAQKTLLKQIISKYAPLSTELQEAIVADNETENPKAPPIDVTPTETSIEDLIGAPEEAPGGAQSDFKSKDDEEVDQDKKSLKRAENASQDTSYPEEEIPDFDAETGEIKASDGNLFDNLGDLQ